MARFGSHRWRGLVPLTGWFAVAWGLGAAANRSCAEEPAAAPAANAFAAEDAAEPPAPDDDGGVRLPADRGKDRQLDRATRLADAGRWTDAVLILDELVADDSDTFADERASQATRRSVRHTAAQMIESLPAAGRDAYGLVFRSRAERALEQAVAANDAAAIVAVARRWFTTPAGHHAALMTAVAALESGRPVEAAAWLDRLAALADTACFEPTLSLMRALALQRAGDPQAANRIIREAAAGRHGPVRLAGREVNLSFAAGQGMQWLADVVGLPPSPRVGDEWRQLRGDAARNAIANASRPLLAPRYRVPLTRHPEEARLLEKRRSVAGDAGRSLLPAAAPLAVNGLIVVRTPLGVLAVDFETGKRLWLQSGAAGSEPADAAAVQRDIDLAFEDATSGGLSSDGRSVFAVESRPRDLLPAAPAVAGGRDARRGGNSLAAYELDRQGGLRWRLPQGDGDVAADAWYLGAPLVVGDELFVLVEEKGELRLDVLAATTGAVVWSQPLAEFDEAGRGPGASQEISRRRQAGLTPALGEGVLVCPVGAGVVAAIDATTRSLLWAHRYRALPAVRQEPDPSPAPRGGDAPRRCDPCPVIAGGRVLLTPYDSDDLLCLGLRDGQPAWPAPRPGRLRIAGVVEESVIVVGPNSVEALSLATGVSLWQRPLGDAAAPSGRGILTAKSLFLPVDAPEVIEIRIADGSIAGRAAARGGAVPGNLVAYRGEIISRGVDSLDVFHQVDALEPRIERAFREDPRDTWAASWRGQADLDAGRVAAGLEPLVAAATSTPPRIAPRTLADALVFALQRDFTAAAPHWKSLVERGDPAARSAIVTRVAVDAFLRSGDLESAWLGCRHLLAAGGEDAAGDLVRDPSDAALAATTDRWLRGRLAEFAARAPEPLQHAVAAAAATAIDSAVHAVPIASRQRRLEVVAERLGSHPTSRAARDALVAELDRRVAGGETDRLQAVRRALLKPPDGRPSQAAAARAGQNWPPGKVVARVEPDEGGAVAARSGALTVPLVPPRGADDAAIAGMGLAYDLQLRRIVVRDDCGRRILEPLPIDPVTMPMPWLAQPPSIQASVAGRLLFVRAGSHLSAFDLEAEPGQELLLWQRPERSAPGSGRQWGPAGRISRAGNVPLGLVISEPDAADGLSGGVSARASAQGLLSRSGRTVSLLDPVSGRVLWERGRVPAAAEWIGDDEVACGCTPDGRGSVVLAMADGRLLERRDLPHRRQRLAVHGRRIMAARPLDEVPGERTARRVLVEVVDPAVRESRPVGEFSGEARSTRVGDDHVAIIEPDGTFTLLDIAAGNVALRVALPTPPARIEYVHVIPWEDRYLVFAGAPDAVGGEADEDIDIQPLHELMLAGETGPPLSGSLWAVAREGGGLLWPTAATIRRHCLHAAQPAGLPVLLFCRRMHAEQRGHTLGVLVLDKRTGQAVLEEDGIRIPADELAGCELVGNPQDHTIMVRDAAGRRLATLQFTGEPLSQSEPFQAASSAPH
ncbi:MAG: hypothetical protein DWI03_06955 [Planctomycetota bacterium]|jgi:outer membrane protein assembly factor BamB|nr:MAG: hypothetical protein DWI03_06955 [Planctomycetota bacterium]